jgi:hypothetical protein
MFLIFAFLYFFSGHICYQSPGDFGSRFPNFLGALISDLRADDRTKQVNISFELFEKCVH